VRVPTHRYSDPLDEIWLACAARIGFAVARTGEAYAVTRGDGVIRVGARELLDPDDGLAQMLLHELCHALVEGEEAWTRPDWGLDNMSERDTPREEACLRLQATLLGAVGLRRVLAPTTDHRALYDALPGDALAGAGRAVELARIAHGRAQRKPFAPHLHDALAASAVVVRAAAPFATPASLWSTVEADPERHPTGLLLGDPALTCESCAWRHRARGAERCRQAGGTRVDPSWRACQRHEPALDCQACGACCREAYDSVTVPPRDPVVKSHPELIVKREGYLELRREGSACAALAHEDGRYACRIYDDRPAPCRGMERAGANCLEARRRVGLSRS
jgi:hypothetical protein